MKIDLLEMELNSKQPHWLSPYYKYSDKIEAIRAKYRAKWMAERELRRQKLNAEAENK